MELIEEGLLDKEFHAAVADYNSAVLHGIVKIASKMGISTIQSYQSAQIFEAVGIARDVIDVYFTNTISRVGGIGLREIGALVDKNHARAFDPLGLGTDLTLDSLGAHKARAGHEDHMYNPQTIHLLQESARRGDYGLFKQYTALVDDEHKPHTLRGLLDIKYAETAHLPGRSGVCGVHCQALQDRRHELRLHLPGGPRVHGPCHEPAGRKVQLRRGRRAARAPGHGPVLCHQAGGLWPVRCHQRVPGIRQRDPDQDGPGGQARRGRSPARPEGLSLDRQDPLLHPRRLPDLPAASPRHLLHRGPGPADLRPEKCQPPGPDLA